MHRYFNQKELLIASHNQGKIVELKELLATFNIKLYSASDFNLPIPEETGDSFEENAALKARYYGQATGMAALADDSGLCIDELNGEPGIYSARWAEADDFGVAINKVQTELAKKNKTTSTAQFVCALALWWPDEHVENFTGYLKGSITFPPRGINGFGYDPIFVPLNHTRTLAEMGIAQKNLMSHRNDAFNKLIRHCFVKK
jgi:XTP/dITP diphosphohydrolase